MHATLLLTVGAAAFAGIVAMTIASRLRVPAIVLLLATGALLGRSGLGIVRPEAMGDGLKVLIELAVAVILFEGALTLRLDRIHAHRAVIRNLLTVGAA